MSSPVHSSNTDDFVKYLENTLEVDSANSGSHEECAHPDLVNDMCLRCGTPVVTVVGKTPRVLICLSII